MYRNPAGSKVLPLSQCSRSCGSGVQRRELRCGERDSQGGYVGSGYTLPLSSHFSGAPQTPEAPPRRLGSDVLSGRCGSFCPGMWSIPCGGAEIRPNLHWISSRSAVQRRAQSAPGWSLAEQRPAPPCQAGSRLPGSRCSSSHFNCKLCTVKTFRIMRESQ